MFIDRSNGPYTIRKNSTEKHVPLSRYRAFTKIVDWHRHFTKEQVYLKIKISRQRNILFTWNFRNIIRVSRSVYGLSFKWNFSKYVVSEWVLPFTNRENQIINDDVTKTGSQIFLKMSIVLSKEYWSAWRWNRSGFLTTSTGTSLSRSDRTEPAGLKFILEPLLFPDNDKWCRELETKAVDILSGRYSWDPVEVLYIFTWRKQNFNFNRPAGMKSRPVSVQPLDQPTTKSDK